MVRTEARLLLTRSRVRVGAFLVGTAAVAVAATPVVLFGDPETVGAGGWWLGLQLGGAAACVLGPVLIMISTGIDFDRGTRRARHLAGVDVSSLSLAQTVASVAIIVMTTIVTGAATLLAGLVDQITRRLVGPAATLVDAGPAIRALPLLMMGALGATLVAALLVHAVGSGKKAALIIVVALASYALPLTMIIDDPPWLALLPAGPLWQVISPAANPVQAPTSWFIGSAIGWSLLLLALGVRGIRRV